FIHYFILFLIILKKKTYFVHFPLAFLRQKHLLFYSYYLFLISHYYLIYFDYLSLMIVLVLAQLSNRQFVDSFVEFLILNVLHICQYIFSIGLSLSFFHLSFFLNNQTILFFLFILSNF